MFGREPAVIMGVVQALLALGLSFGLKLEAEQVGAIMAAVAAVLSVIVRHQVTPTKPNAQPNQPAIPG